jgi:O-antigen/teichoic acid export membrane protein
VGAYVARYLGPSQYGLLNYSITVISLFSVIASLGLESIAVRELIKNERRTNVILGTAFILRLIASVTVLLVIWVFAGITHSDPLTRQILFIISATVLFEIFQVIDYFFQAKVLSKYFVWSQMIALVIVSIIRVSLVVNEASLHWFAWSYVLDVLTAGLGFLYFAWRRKALFQEPIKWSSRVGLYLMKNSWPLIFSSFAVTIYMKIDQVMIKWLISDEANGMYGVAVRLSEMWNFIPVAICASFFPAILNAKLKDETLYKERLQKLYDLMVSISVVVAIAMTVLSPFIVRTLFGEQYSDSADILTLYIWSGVFVFLGVANGKWIIAENLQVFRMNSLVAAGILNIILNFIFIRWFGLRGAAISTIISYAFASYFSLLLTRRTRPAFIACTRSFNPFRIIQHLLHYKPE